MTGATETQTDVARRTGVGIDDIRPFHVSFPDADVADLRKRVKATKWPEVEQVSDEAQGVQLATMQKLAHYWGTDYDWKKAEAKIKAKAEADEKAKTEAKAGKASAKAAKAAKEPKEQTEPKDVG